jgi:hypothetical protein
MLLARVSPFTPYLFRMGEEQDFSYTALKKQIKLAAWQQR